VDRHSSEFRSLEDESPESEIIEDSETRLTTEERDQIIREYNKEHSQHESPDSEELDMDLIDSDDITDKYEGMEPAEKLAHLLGELTEVGNLALNMRFLNQEELDELLTVGKKFLGGCKSTIVSERSRLQSEESLSETEDVEQ
jgi:hypothetical protein